MWLIGGILATLVYVGFMFAAFGDTGGATSKERQAALLVGLLALIGAIVLLALGG